MNKENQTKNEIINQFIDYCEMGRTTKLIELLKNGLDLNEKYEERIELIDLGLTKILMAQWLGKKRGMKKARLNKCMDYLLNLNIDYSKCYLSFFIATCITCNFECSNKLIQLGFKINDEYKNKESYYNHILYISLDRYGKYMKKYRKYNGKVEKMRSIEYLADCNNIEYENCIESITLIVSNNQIKILKKLISKGLDLNKEIDNIKLIDKLEIIAIEEKNKKMIKFLKRQKIKMKK